MPLRLRSWEPSAARGAVVVVHGLGEHSGRYAALAEHLTAEGIAVYAPDLPGHGLSGGRRGHVARFEDHLAAVDRSLEEARSRGGALPTVLFGHSMGGLVALRYAESRPRADLAGLALSAPQISLAAPPAAWLRAAAAVLDVVLPSLPLSNRIAPENLSHDPSEVEAYRGDPLVHDRITPRHFRAMRREMIAAVTELASVRVPAALVIIPGADPVVDAGATRAMVTSLRAFTTVEVREYPGLFHEPLHEVGRETVVADLVSWVAGRID
jgi:lysophospholipase